MRIILNPMARHGAGRRARPLIERELERHRIAADFLLTEGPGHAEILAREAAEMGVPRVVAAGGDGTVHEVANGLMAAAGSMPELGLIPVGTGNDFVKMVPGTSTTAEAVRTLVSGDVMRMDVGAATWSGRSEYFVNAMGTGIDVEVVRQMRRSRFMPGGVIYVTALLRALLRYRPLPLQIRVDGTARTRRIMTIAVANGPSIGGSFRICPDARPDDGQLDVCVIHEMPLQRNIRLLPHIIRGTHTGSPDVTMMRGTVVHLRLTGGGPLHFQLDGELREGDGEDGVTMGIAERKLNVIHAGTTARHQGSE